jgi:hypothetical protein
MEEPRTHHLIRKEGRNAIRTVKVPDPHGVEAIGDGIWMRHPYLIKLESH